MCLRPLSIKKTAESVRIVPCGKCHLCLKKKSQSWAFRIEQQQKITTSSIFLTLTYETAPLTKTNLQTLKKHDFQKFIKRIRKNSRSPIKYYACGEYGTHNHRPHYHAIIFNLPQDWINSSEKLHQAWGNGHIQIDPCNGATIRYVTNYITTSQQTTYETSDDRQKEFNLMSKSLGANYLTDNIKHHHRTKLINYITKPSGQIQSLPRYYIDKLFDDEMKAILKESSEEARTINFEKLFNNNPIKKLSWKKDQRRKIKKENQQLRNKTFSADNSTQLIQAAEAKQIQNHQKQHQTCH